MPSAAGEQIIPIAAAQLVVVVAAVKVVGAGAAKNSVFTRAANEGIRPAAAQEEGGNCWLERVRTGWPDVYTAGIEGLRDADLDEIIARAAVDENAPECSGLEFKPVSIEIDNRAGKVGRHWIGMRELNPVIAVGADNFQRAAAKGDG